MVQLTSDSEPTIIYSKMKILTIQKVLNVKLVFSLGNRHINPDLQDNDGNTPLMIAVRSSKIGKREET